MGRLAEPRKAHVITLRRIMGYERGHLLSGQIQDDFYVEGETIFTPDNTTLIIWKYGDDVMRTRAVNWREATALELLGDVAR